jgi:sugar phosphate isomerase/epimerase
MIWGMTSAGWMGGLYGFYDGTPDPLRGLLELLHESDLHATEWSSRDLMEMEPARREEMAALAQDYDVRICLGVGVRAFGGDEEALKRSTERSLEAIEVLAPMFRSPLCISGVGPYSSFTREPSVEEQIERLAEVLAPVAEAAHRAGCPLGLHNAGHYCSDVAELCRRTPHLGILFDTGNPFLVGERPIRAAADAAPYTVGTHFKDHHVAPNKQARPLCVDIVGAALGEGDANLREIYGILRENTPGFDDLTMLMAIDPIAGLTEREALQKCVEFVRSL